MARKPRNESGPGAYHVYSRGNRKAPIFRDDADRRTFLLGLRLIQQDKQWRLLAWCLMENHFHFVVETVDANLGRGMQWLLSGYARMFNERHGLEDHLFRQHFGCTLIMDDDHMRTALRYVARNPVTAGLAARPQDYRWAGQPGQPERPAEPPTDDARLLNFFDGSLELYEAFVQAA